MAVLGEAVSAPVLTGRDRQEFGCFEFRTMRVDADARVAELQAQAGAGALLFKMKDDPRITKPRDVAPRLLHRRAAPAVQRRPGDMTLVGPRPQIAAEVAPGERLCCVGSSTHRVRPGMTGLWQVFRRSSRTWQSLGRTLGAAVSSRGAY